jgi:2-polyprenyl-3-methyl-5-hydroxy-6-metoxy-1,4-benzoquinol methylase
LIHSIRTWLAKSIDRSSGLNYGRDTIVAWVSGYVLTSPGSEEIRILDIGCGRGTDLSNIKRSVGDR